MAATNAVIGPTWLVRLNIEGNNNAYSKFVGDLKDKRRPSQLFR